MTVCKGCSIAIIALLTVLSLESVAEDKSSAQGKLPKIDAFQLDGNLIEWGDVAPIRTGKMEHASNPLEWKGSTDAAMTIFYAWSDDGLYVAGQVSDADNAANQDPQKADYLELFFTTSTDPRTNHLARGVLRGVITPPAPKKDISVSFPSPPSGASGFEKVEIKGKKTEAGYVFELFIPWELLSGFKPKEGAIVSVGQALNDSDPKRVYKQLLSRAANGSGERKLTQLELVPKADFSKVSATELLLYSNIQIPSPCTTQKIPLTLEIAPQLLKKSAGVTLSIVKDSKELVTRKYPTQDFKSLNGVKAIADSELNAAQIGDGEYEIRLTLNDAAGKDIVSASQTLTLLAGAEKLVADTTEKLAGIKLAELAEKDPFKASSCFGTVAALEWLKWGIEQKKTHAMLDASTEIRTRLAVFDGAEMTEKDSMYSLIELTRNPEAQFVVEYIRERTPLYPKKASVAVSWGMFPLMTAHVSEFKTPKEAEASLDEFGKQRIASTLKIVTTECLNIKQSKAEILTPEKFSPEEYALMISGPKQAEAIPLSELNTVKADAVFFFEKCPAKAREEIEKWAQASKLPLAEPQKIKGYKAILYAGTPDDSPQARAFKDVRINLNRISPETGILYFSKGRLAFMLPYVSLESAKLFAQVILEGKPGTVEQANALRQAIVKATKRTPGKLNIPEGMNVYCGDMHTHSFLSDGRPTPLTVSAEAVYCGLDFNIISDHGVFNGAFKHRDSMDKNGLKFETIPGMEVNSKWGHLNIYPIKTGVPYGPERSDVIKASHAQNAVIQWNHPQLEGEGAKADFENGIAGTGLDAWEHYPPKYTQWKKEGKLPVLTGGTDTHDGTFSMPERTVVLAPTNSGADIAEAVRKGNVLLLDPWNGAYGITRHLPMCYDWNDLYFYGSDRMIQLAVDVLADAQYTKELKKKRLKETLRDVKLKPLIEASSAHETVK